jgi:KDO2-lipid IV(A) lauroyltransferase
VLLYWAFRLAAALAKAAPLPVAYRAAALCGVAVFYAWPGGRRRCIANMRRVVGDARAAAVAKRSFANYAVYLVDFLRFDAMTAEEVRSRVAFDGWAELNSYRAGSGAVLVTMHFGNWDLGAAAVADHGIPISVVADTFHEARLNDLVLGARRHLGMEILAAERMGPSVLRALRSENVVALLIDVPPPGGEVEVEFFGGRIAVPDGMARIALRAGARVVAVTMPREHARSPRVRGDVEPVPFEPSGDAERDVQSLTQATMRVLEQMVRRNPEQWYVFRALWVEDRKRALRVTATAP